MQIIARSTLIKFLKRYPDAEQPLKSWFQEAKNVDWKTLNDIKNQYRNASILKKEPVIFNIVGNKYRLVVQINFKVKLLYIRFIGTHKEYDLIDAETI